jgi:hypothetical protein
MFMNSWKNRLAWTCLALLAVLMLIPGGASAVTISRPWGNHAHDSDRRVPEYYGCYAGQWAGLTRKRVSSTGEVACRIYYDKCAMNRLNAGPRDWDKLRAHERAHARGFAHYEGSPSTNPAYYPKFNVCHC